MKENPSYGGGACMHPSQKRVTPHTGSGLTGYPVTRRKLNMALEIVPNDIDEATHALMDASVLKTADYEPSNPPLAAFLLATIVEKSDNKLDGQYSSGSNARDLLNRHPDLADLLKDAWKEQAFKKIRNLKILRPGEVRRAVALGVPIEQRDAVVQAFSSEYRGLAYRILLQAVDEVDRWPVERHYAKIIPIAQSSGTGKSKMVDKIAMERILFPLCLREDLGTAYYAYPPTDIAVRNYLLGAPSTTEETKCKTYLRAFLCSLFASAYRQATAFVPADEQVSYAYIADNFYNLFKDTSSRNSFYDDVLSATSLSSTRALESFQVLENFLKQCCFDWPVTSCPILVSMDEIHVLFDLRAQDSWSTYNLYSRLKSVLSEMVSAHLCVVVLSTATDIPTIAPLKDIAPSMRERDDERFLPAPFTELPFDVHIIAEPLVPGMESLTSVGSLGFTAKFGRPLFYATYLSRVAQNESHSTILDGMMLTIREKLCGRRWPPASPAGLDVSSIAVLSVRLLFELSPTSSDARQYEEELVRSHLRNLFSVHQNRLSLVSGYSPEPLVAEAAAQIMHYHIGSKSNGDHQPYMNIWDLLGKYVDGGLAAQGTVGELIGRILSITAMDNAIDALPRHSELKFQTPVSVVDYYKAFLTDEAWESLRGSTPTNRTRLSQGSAAKTFEQAFGEAYLHFSHYGKANDASPIRNRYLWGLWLRGTAILCQLNQELTDRAHPIFFAKFGTVSPQSMSISLDQDKTGQSVDSLAVGIQSAEVLKVFSPGNGLPYIAAVHCYALTNNEGISVGLPYPRSLRHPVRDEEAPRYQIDFRGLASYRNLTECTKIEIRRIINGSKNALFRHHPRQYGLPLLRQMLPVLQEHPDATAWCTLPVVQEHPHTTASGLLMVQEHPDATASGLPMVQEHPNATTSEMLIVQEQPNATASGLSVVQEHRDVTACGDDNTSEVQLERGKGKQVMHGKVPLATRLIETAKKTIRGKRKPVEESFERGSLCDEDGGLIIRKSSRRKQIR